MSEWSQSYPDPWDPPNTDWNTPPSTPSQILPSNQFFQDPSDLFGTDETLSNEIVMEPETDSQSQDKSDLHSVYSESRDTLTETILSDNEDEYNPESGRKVFAPSVSSNSIPAVETFPADPKDATSFDIYVKNPEIQGDGVSAYVTYTIEATTTLDFYQVKELQVKRRFSDFLWLQNQLLNHHKGVIVPPLPDKAIFQTNKISGNRFSQTFLEYRRRELERFLTRVVSHPSLCTSKYLQLFLETQDSSKFVEVIQEEKPASSGRFFSSIISKATAVTGFGSTVGTEVDSWFSEKSAFISNIKLRLDTLISTSQQVTQLHYDSVTTHMHFMDALKAMGTCEAGNNPTLSLEFTRLSEIMAQLQICEHELADNSSREFVDMLNDYSRIISNVQKVLEWRLMKLGDFQLAEKDYEQKHQKSVAKPGDSKLQAAAEAAHLKIAETKEIFDCASELVKAEIIRFEATKSQEIHNAIIQFAHCNLNREICMLDLWKKFAREMQ